MSTHNIKNPDNPIVAIETPTHNRAQSLPTTIESILAQRYPHWRMMIIDDGSTDETKDVVAPYVQADSRIIFLRREENRGHLAARNIALDHLPNDATWITQLDSDDVFLPDALETMTQTATEFQHARSFKFTSHWADGPSACSTVTSGRTSDYQDRLLGKAPRGEWTNFHHRCFIDDGLRYDERLRRTPSVAFSLHLLRITTPYYFPSVVRIMNRGNTSTTRPTHKDAQYYQELIEVHKVFFEQFGEDLFALSRAAYSKRMSTFSRDCAHAGLSKDAFTYLQKAITTHPWDYRHMGTFSTCLKSFFHQ